MSQGDWGSANKKTLELVFGMQSEFGTNQLFFNRYISCDRVQAVDKLWRGSNNVYGFAYQIRVFQQVNRNEKAFRDRVGLNWAGVIPSYKNPKGDLPLIPPLITKDTLSGGCIQENKIGQCTLRGPGDFKLVPLSEVMNQLEKCRLD